MKRGASWDTIHSSSEFKANSFTKKQIVWVACGINHGGILVPGSTGPGQYGAVELLV